MRGISLLSLDTPASIADIGSKGLSQLEIRASIQECPSLRLNAVALDGHELKKKHPLRLCDGLHRQGETSIVNWHRCAGRGLDGPFFSHRLASCAPRVNDGGCSAILPLPPSTTHHHYIDHCTSHRALPSRRSPWICHAASRRGPLVLLTPSSWLAPTTGISQPRPYALPGTGTCTMLGMDLPALYETCHR